MKTRNKVWLITGLLIAITWLIPAMVGAQDFDINKGIVGNLGETCRNTGNCDFCDFLYMFVVLQKVILSLFAGLALIMLLWGTIGLITAAGNQEKITAGKKLITSTLFGVLIIMLGYFLVQMLYNISVTPNSGEAIKQQLTCSGLSGTKYTLCALDPTDTNCLKSCPTGLTGGSQAVTVDTYPLNKNSKEICCLPAPLSTTWWSSKLGCPVPKSEADKDFCKTHDDGTTCKIMTGAYTDSGKCQDKVCVSNCTTELKSTNQTSLPDALCQNYSLCGFLTLNDCKADSSNCKTGLCDGDENRVCCRTKN